MLDELLGPLHRHFLSAGQAYHAYLDEGRTFRHASSLRRINAAARSLLLAQGWRLPDEHRACAAALIGHYDAWMTLWDELAARTRPAPGDRFVFDNAARYPREAEQQLERLYEEILGANC